jgi:hypothetical protein
VDILTGVYATGKKCSEGFLENMTIIFDPKKSVWENYPVAVTGRQSGGCN